MNHVYRLKRSGRAQLLQPVPETARASGKGTRTATTWAQAVTATLASVALGGMATLAHAQQAPPAANQLPQGGVVTRGSANIVTNTGQAQLSVNQSSNRAVIDWASFNVGSQAKVQFNQPSSSAVTLNNILGNNASQIYGQISANGQVFLSNPNGVYFSPTAQVNVGGLVATTGKANADEFMAGKASFNRAGSTGSVVNEGQLQAALGGYIALLAPEVRNQGVIIAQAGTVALASGETITLNFSQNAQGLAGITTTPQTLASLIENRSAVRAEGGQIILSAHALASLQGSVVKNSGQLSATSLSTKGGKIVLMGDKIELTSTSQIEASGATDGGTVLVGGDWQGQGDMRQATQVTLAQGASIEANATQQGDGGKVVLWSDVKNASSQTNVAGSISAEGRGANSTGGQVETSGGQLKVADTASVRMGGPGATGGRWLLDPTDFTIAASGGDITGAALGASITAGNTVEILSDSGTTGTLGNINVNDTVSWNNNGTLKLTAAGGVTGSGAITMGVGSGTVVFNQAGNSTYAGNITGSGAKVSKSGQGALTFSGSGNTYTGGTTVTEGSLISGVNNAFGQWSFTINGGNLSLGTYSQTAGTFVISSNGGTVSSTTGVLTASSYSVTSERASTLSAVLGWNNFLSKSGSGTLTLSGANGGYSGPITVSGGTLKVGSATALGTGTVSVSSGAALDLNGQTLTSTNSLTLSGSGVNSGGALTNSSATQGTYAGAITLAASATIAGNTRLTSSTPIGGAFGLTLDGALGGRVSSPINTTSLTKTGAGTWTVDVAGTYTGGTTVRQGSLVSGVAEAFGPGDITVNSNDMRYPAILDLGAFDQTAAAVTMGASSGTVLSSTISGTTGVLTGSSFTVYAGSGHTALISAKLDGVGALTAPVLGTLILAADNTFTGGTWLQSGTLQFGNGGTSGSLLSGSNLRITGADGGTTLAFNLTSGAAPNYTNTGSTVATGGSVTYSNLAYGSTLDLRGMTLMNGSNYRVRLDQTTATPTASAMVLPSNRVASNTPLIVTTNGYQSSFTSPVSVFSWSGSPSTTPPLQLNGATVATGVDAAGGKMIYSSTSGVTLGAGAMWTITSNGTTNAYYTATDSTAANFTSGTQSIVVPPGVSVTHSGALSGSGSVAALRIGGGGTLTLAGDNSNLSGALTLNAGTLRVGSTTALGTGAITVNSGAALDLAGQTPTAPGALSLSGTGVNNSGALFNSGGDAAYGGLLSISANTLIVGGSGRIHLTHTGTTLGQSRNVTLAGAQGGSWAASLGTSSQKLGTLTKEDSGTWTLSGANPAYTGAITVNGGGLRSGSATAFGDSTGTVSAITVNSGAALDLNGQTLTSIGTLTLSGTGMANGGALFNSSATSATYAGPLVLGSDTLIVGGSGTIALSNTSTITGSSYVLNLGGAQGGSINAAVNTGTTGSINKQDSGTWTLSRSSTFAGGLTVNGGILAAGAANAFGSSSTPNNINLNGGTLALGTYAQTTLGQLTVGPNGGGITGTGALTAGGFNFSNTGAVTVSAPLAGTGVPLLKTGTGQLSLGSVNTYTGPTIVRAGLLEVNNRLDAAGQLAVASGATVVYKAAGTTSYTGAFTGQGTLANQTHGSVLNLSGANLNRFSGTLEVSVNQSDNATTLSTITLPNNPNLAGKTFSVNTTGYDSNLTSRPVITWTGTATGTPSLLLNGNSTTSGTVGFGGSLTLLPMGNPNLSIGPGALWSLSNNNGATSFYSSVTDSAGATLTGNATVTILPGYSVAQTGSITGSYSLMISGGGTLTLSGNNSYSGGTIITAGNTLKTGSATALGTGATTVNSGGALDLGGQILATSAALTLNGTGISNSGALFNSSATAASYAGLVSLGSASSIIGGAGTIALTSTSGTGITGAHALTLGGTSGGTIATPIYIGAGSLTKQGAGTWTLSGLSAFTGGVTVNAGTLAAGVTHNTGQFSAFGGGSNPITVNGGTLALGTYSQNTAAVTVGSDGGSITSSTGVLRASSITFNNTAAASASAILYTTNGLTKNGSGTTTLSGANAYTGGTFINAGTLQIASDANLGTVPNTAATNITINGGTLQGSNAAALVNLNANRLISVGSAGATFNSTDSVYSMAVNGAISGSGPVTFTSAKDITVGSIVLSNNSAILLKAAGSITQNASTTVSTVGGNITYWSDSDANGDGTIAVVGGTSGANTTISSGGAQIVMGGGNGASAVTGFARGGSSAINLGSNTRVQAGAGNVTLRGMASSNGGTGVHISGVVSGTDVNITGRGFDNAGANTTGLSLNGAMITASNLANINGTGGATLSTATSEMGNVGIRMSTSIIEATGSGNVLVTATGGGYLLGTDNSGIEMSGGSTDNAIRSVNGTVTVNAAAGPTRSTGSGWALKTTHSSQAGNVIIGGPSQVGAITVNADSMSFDTLLASKFTQVQSSGPVTLTSQSASFSSPVLYLSNVSFANTLSSLNVGQVGNTKTIYLGTPGAPANSGVASYTIAGPISIYGYADINRPVVSTGTGSNGRITLGGSVIQRTGGSVTGTELLLAGTGSSLVQMFSSGNSFGTLAGSGLGQFMLGTSSALTVGTLGSTQGLTSNSTIELYTSQGDLTLNNNIVTTGTTSDAMTLTASKNAAVGDTTSGNLVFNGGTISVGTGGRARLYTGAVNNPTLTTLVGSGSGRFRYGSTQTVTNFSTPILTGGLYAIYRERPTVSWSSSSDQTIVYGSTPVAPVAGTQAGFVNGDQADPDVVLRVASSNAPAALNRNGGYYDVGSYVYNRTTIAQNLGYLASNPRLTITAAALNVTANDFTKSYDGLSYSGGNGVVYTGFLPGDSVANSLRGTLSYAGTAQSAVNAGSYSIVPTGLTSSNYSLNFVNGTLTVNKVPLIVTINDTARFVVEADTPGYKGASYVGWVNNEGTSVLGGSLTIARTGGDTAAGIYKGVLQGGGLTSSNYNISYVSGNYTIVPADQLMVELTNTSSTYAGATTYGLTSARYYRSSTRSIVDLTSNAVLSGNALTLNDGAGGNTAFTVGTLAPVLSSAGKLSVGAYQLGATSISNTSANYSNTITVTGSLQINPKEVSASVTSNASKPYDGTTVMNGLTLGVSGTVAGDVVTAAGNASYASKDAGTGLTYNVNNITLSGQDARNYVLTDSVTRTGSNTLTGNNGVITPVVLNISADNASKSYDGIAWSGGNGVTYSGFVGTEDATVLGGSLAYGGTSQGARNAGTYSIIPSGLSSNNYTIEYSNGSLIINPAGLMAITGTVVAPTGAAITKVYDGNNIATLAPSNYAIVGWATGEGAAVSKTTGTYDSADAGSGKTVTVSLLPSDYVATGSTTLSNYYLPTSVSGAVGVITPKPVTVTNNARTFTYDAVTNYGTLASGTAFTTSTMVGSDSVGSVSYAAQGMSASGVAQAGTFAVRASNAVMAVGNSANYDFTYVDASHTVAKANLAVTASSLTSTPSLTGNVYNGNAYTGTYTSNALGNDARAMTVTGVATGTNAGTYTSNLAVTGAVLSNYNTPVITNADLVVSPKPVTVTNTARSTTYDGTSSYATLANGTQFTTSALVGSDALASVTQTASGTGVTPTAVAQAGSFSVTPSAAVLGTGTASNYDFSYVASTHTVDKANLALSATASLTGNVYRGTAYTGTYTSNALGNDARAMTVTGVATGTNAGTYTSNLAVTGAVLSNYNTPVITNADLVISPATVTVTPINGVLQGNVSKVYDGTDVATLNSGNFLLTGWIGAEGATVTKTTGTYDTPTAGSAKTVTVNLSNTDYTANAGTNLSNYRLPGVVSGAVGSITKAPLTATGNSASMTYNGANQSVSGFTVSGLQGSDTVGSLSSVVASGATAKNAGSYTNTVTAGTETNYTVTTVNGSLDIAKANATVTANSGTLTYNGGNQTVSGFTASALVGGETAAVLTGVSASRTEKNAGTYATSASGTDGNYNLTFVNGSMVINKADLTVRANDDARFVTQSDPAGYQGVSYSGWVGGESSSALSGSVSVSRSGSGPDGNRSGSSALAGTYTGALIPSGLSSANYTIRYLQGSYTIVPAEQLLVKMAPASNVYATVSGYTVAEAKYLNRSNVIVDLTSNVIGQGTGSFSMADGSGGQASFGVSPSGSVLTGAGQLAAGSYPLAATGVSVTSNNFSGNLTLVGSQSVSPAPLTATPVVNKVYDGNTTINQLAVPLSGVLAGDAVSAVGSGAFASKNAGIGLSYTLSGLSVSGADSGNYYLTTPSGVSGTNGTISRAPLNVSIAAQNKVYDGSTAAKLTLTDNRFSGDAVSVTATGRFADKNVGASKSIAITGLTLSGSDASNYILNAPANTTAAITRLAQVTWVGGATGSWFDQANWAGGAVPDLANVANVIIPAGVTVSFDNISVAPAQAGPVSIDSLGMVGSLSQSAGTLNVGAGGVTLNALAQSGGELNTTGALTLGSLSQTAGSLSAGSLSTVVPYNHTGSGSLTVAGQVVPVIDSMIRSLPQLPLVLTPDVPQGQDAYQVTVIKLPQGNEAGVVHIELRDGISDVEITLPDVLQDWLKAAGAELSLQEPQDGVQLSPNRSVIRLSDSATRRFPVRLAMQAGQQRLSFRIVKRP